MLNKKVAADHVTLVAMMDEIKAEQDGSPLSLEVSDFFPASSCLGKKIETLLAKFAPDMLAHLAEEETGGQNNCFPARGRFQTPGTDSYASQCRVMVV